MPLHLLFDQNITARMVARLKATGISCSHVRERGLLHAPDEDIFARAAEEEWTIVTADVDYTRLAVGSRRARPSVIHVRCVQPYNEALLADRLRFVCLTLATELEEGAIVTVKNESERVRRLPLSDEPKL